MEQLDRRAEKGETLSPEENTLLALLERLIQDYDDRIELPAVPPLQMLLYLMEQRGLRQADLVPIFGSRSVASDVLNGKREFSKAHIPPLKCFYNRSETTAATRKRRARTIAWASGPSSISMGFHSPAWSSD
jgi:HTH-type transcriptional regulator/antitoxin HigA